MDVKNSNINLPPLNALRAYSEAARQLSITKAAESLNVSHSAVSQQIKLLESYLGIELLIRQGRQIKLTELGAIYAEKLQHAFEEILQATGQLYSTRQPNKLTISMPASLATHWFIPRLDQLQQQHPELEIHLVTAQHKQQEVLQGSVDCTIYSAATPWENLENTQLFADDLVLICSPALLGNQVQLNLQQERYKYIYVTAALRQSDWPLWFEQTNTPKQKEKNWLRVSNTIQALQAARNGLGLALTHLPFIADDLNDNILTKAVPEQVSTGRDFYLAANRNLARTPKYKIIKDFLKQSR